MPSLKPLPERTRPIDADSDDFLAKLIPMNRTPGRVGDRVEVYIKRGDSMLKASGQIVARDDKSVTICEANGKRVEIALSKVAQIRIVQSFVPRKTRRSEKIRQLIRLRAAR
jgi:hypothetical protein